MAAPEFDFIASKIDFISPHIGAGWGNSAERTIGGAAFRALHGGDSLWLRVTLTSAFSGLADSHCELSTLNGGSLKKFSLLEDIEKVDLESVIAPAIVRISNVDPLAAELLVAPVAAFFRAYYYAALSFHRKQYSIREREDYPDLVGRDARFAIDKFRRASLPAYQETVDRIVSELGVSRA